MAITYTVPQINNGLRPDIICLSTDTLPTTVDVGTTAYLSDIEEWKIFKGSAWVVFDVGSGSPADLAVTVPDNVSTPISYLKGLIQDILGVHVDSAIGSDTGTGVHRDPVKTIEQAVAICLANKTRWIYLHGAATYTMQADLTRFFDFEGDDRDKTILAFNGKNMYGSNLENLQISGTNGGTADLTMEDVTVGTSQFNGKMFNCKVDGSLTVPGGSTLIGSDIKFGDSGTIIASDAVNPVTVKLRDCTGMLLVQSFTNAASTFKVRARSMSITLDSSNTAGTLTIKGTYELTNNASSTVVTNYRNLVWKPLLPTTGDLESGTKTITVKTENATPDYSHALTIPAAPDTAVFQILRIAARLGVQVDSFAGGAAHCYCSVYVDTDNAAANRLFTAVDITATASITYASSVCGAATLATIFNLLKDGNAHTFYFHLWIDAGTNAVISYVNLWEGVGDNAIGSTVMYRYLQINLLGNLSIAIKTNNAAQSANGTEYLIQNNVITVDGSSLNVLPLIFGANSATGPVTLSSSGIISDSCLYLCGYSQAGDFNYLYSIAINIKQEL